MRRYQTLKKNRARLFSRRMPVPICMGYHRHRRPGVAVSPAARRLLLSSSKRRN